MSDSDERISALYRASRQRAEPPPELDQRILAEAHRAVSRRHPLPYRSLALAATVVLGVGLAWLQLYSPQIAHDEATVPTWQADPQAEDREALGTSAMIRREAPAASAALLPQQESAPGMAAPQPVSPAPPTLRQALPPRSKAQALDEAEAVERDTANAAAAGVDAGQTVTDADGPCGLTVAPADEGAWHTAIREAEARGDDGRAACLRQAFRKAADDGVF
jgi:hypothetical protein